MRALHALAISLSLFAASSAHSEIEKIATICGNAVCPHWWPKVAAPAGWQHDRDHSYHYNFNAFAPSGQSFGGAETVMYANAVYKPRVPEAATLAAFISGDHASFRREVPDLVIRAGEPLKTGDGKLAATWVLEPQSAGQWERVAYFEEGEYYLVFVISSRTASGLQGAMASFEQLVTGYSE